MIFHWFMHLNRSLQIEVYLICTTSDMTVIDLLTSMMLFYITETLFICE